jgi:hypothetical protein
MGLSKQAAFYVAIFTATGLFIGWYFAYLLGSSADLRTRRKQVEALKELRFRSLGAVALLSVLFAAVLYIVAKSK